MIFSMFGRQSSVAGRSGRRRIHFDQGEKRMRVGTARPHLRRYPDRLHQFLVGRTRAERRLGVPFDAVRTLRDVGDGDGDDLLRLRGKRAIGEDMLAEG